MSLRRRIALVAAAAVAVTVLLGSLLTYVLVRGELRGEVDKSLRQRAQAFARGVPAGDRRLGPPRGVFVPLRPPGPLPPAPAPRFGEPNLLLQVVTATGAVQPVRTGGLQLPVGGPVRAVATGRRPAFLSDATVRGHHLRVLTRRVEPGVAVMLARPLDDVDRTLDRIRIVLALLCLGGIALAAALGRVVARATIAPVQRLTDATEHVAATRDLRRRIQPGGGDELGRLATSFNAMLDSLEASTRALEQSTAAQRQLVADASHELRTPISTLRTNIEVLRSSADMPAAERDRLLEDIEGQIDELTALMSDLIDLARGDEPEALVQDVRMDRLVEEAVERARRHAPGEKFETSLEPTVVEGVPERLDRAVGNLLDNAVKWNAQGGPIEVSVRGGEVCVRDHGPGIAAEDLPHVFDRFYRGSDARDRPGSGLGLAIVRQVAESQGGTITAEPADGGGTLMRLSLTRSSAPGADAPTAT